MALSGGTFAAALRRLGVIGWDIIIYNPDLDGDETITIVNVNHPGQTSPGPW